MTRHMALEGIDNLRDYGGYATACGRGLRSGRLFRSAAHHMATEADLQTLAGLGLRMIVDLRRTDERERSPSRRWTGFDAEVLENDIGAYEEGWAQALAGKDPTPKFFLDMHRDWYARAPFEPRLIDLYSRYFAGLCAHGGPVLIHCAAGKDRTGLLAALTQKAAGVHDDDVMADYLLTNEAPGQEARFAFVSRMIEKHSGHAPVDEAVRIAMQVQPECLQIALRAIDERFGGVEPYLEQVLGLDRGGRAAFEERLLGD